MKRCLLMFVLCVMGAVCTPAAPICSIDPAVATNVAGDLHFFDVDVTDGGAPVSGVDVTFLVISGPNAGAADTNTTDSSGTASFLYFSDGRTGKDVIQAIGGGSTTCTAVKVWSLNSPPYAFCLDMVTNAGPNCEVDLPGWAVDNGSFDSDGEIVNYTLTPPGPYPVGTNPVTLTVMDNGHYSADCAATIIVVDTTPPVILCPIQIVTNLPVGVSNAVVNFDTPPIIENCGSFTAGCDPPSGSVFALGTTPVVCTAFDLAGNTNQCVFDIVLNETPAPGNDFTIAKLKGPKTIKLSATVTHVTGLAVATIVNLGDHTETINSLTGLVTLVAQSLGGVCSNATVTLHNGAPNKVLPVSLAPRKKLNIAFDVAFDCANDPLKGVGHQDYRILATVNHSALGTIADSNPANNNCPRPPDAATLDKGCGGKGGTDVLTDVTIK
jgi:hypothetical protein